MRTSFPIALLIVAIGSHALASDGRIEINQASAEAGAVNGSLAADPAGFPVLITRPGSYQLTGDLAMPAATTTAILVADGVSDVTIDLGGFTIRGVAGVNPGPPAWTCFGGGGASFSGWGIRGTGSHIAVRNGRILNMGNDGVSLPGFAGRVEQVLTQQNCGTGIALGNAALVDASQALEHRFGGIVVGADSRVAHSIAFRNESPGIEAGAGSLVLYNASSVNGSHGFQMGNATNAIGNVANQNVGFGYAGTATSAFGMNAADGNAGGGFSNGVASPCNVVNGTPVCTSSPPP